MRVRGLFEDAANGEAPAAAGSNFGAVATPATAAEPAAAKEDEAAAVASE